jgi:anthranilate phosphoribosyltransferase
MDPVALIKTIVSGQSLSQDQAAEAINVLLDPTTTDTHRAAILTAWQFKGATSDELAGLVKGALAVARPCDLGEPRLVDTCGTGGGRSTMNLSTLAAFLAAGAGAKVAKHGNRAVSSKCGSADILAAWQIPLDASLEATQRALQASNVAFLWAPHFHPAFAAVAPVRRELGFRTVFNLVGPLANPAGAQYRLVGVYSPELLHPMADALYKLGVKHAYVVYGTDGLDEISPSATTLYREVTPEGVFLGEWEPSDFGLEPVPEAIYSAGETVESAVAQVEAALTPGGSIDAAIPNAAVALLLAGVTNDLREAANLVRAAHASGAALAARDALREALNS